MIHVQTGAELGPAVLNSRGISGIGSGHVGDVDIRRSKVCSNYLVRRGAAYVLSEERQVGVPGIVLMGEDVVAEISQTNVSHEVGVNGKVYARSSAVVGAF